MAANDTQEQEEPLSEEQRITLLEKSVRLHRWLVFALWLLVVIAASILITFSVVSASSPYSGELTPQHFINLKKQVAALDKQNRSQQKRLDRLYQQIDTLEHAPGGRKATQMMRNTLIGQDQSFSRFIKVMKSGMKDLANMIPGSRTWLGVYEDALDNVIKKSDARVKKLKQQWPERQTIASPITSNPVAQ